MKSVVLLSSGLDSTVNLFEAHRKGGVALALSFDYGQRAAVREISQAARLAKHLGVPHRVLELPFFKDFGQSSLVDRSKEVPTSSVKIDDRAASEQSAKSVWVPNRNGIFLNIAAGFAEALGADAVIPGFNIEEAATFPDNSTDYMRALDKSFSYSTANKVKVVCFTDRLDKPKIAARALELGVPLDMMWPCYFAEEKWCGRCESCQRAKRALIAAGADVTPLFHS